VSPAFYEREKDGDLEIVLKELDHLQNIVGRYDQFFFILKQVMIVSFGAILAFAYDKKRAEVVLLAVLASLVFFGFEFAFRIFHWAPKIRRIIDVSLYLQGKSTDFVLYDLNNEKYRSTHDSFKMSKKPFDIVFYALFACFGIMLLICPKLWLR
jgi:hypothetical protein